MIRILHEQSGSARTNVIQDVNLVHNMSVLSKTDKLIHEHDFKPKGLEGTDSFRICCIICDICYCYLCGKLIA